MRVLVVDWNKVYASWIKKALESLISGVFVDIATNEFEAEYLMDEHVDYAAILVDMYSALDRTKFTQILDRTNAPKILWSISEKLEPQFDKFVEGLNKYKTVSKPLSRSDVERFVTQEVLSATCPIL